MRWKAKYVQPVSPSSHAVNQVLELVVDDMENEEQKRLTKNAAWKSSRMGDWIASLGTSWTSTSHLLDLDFNLNTP